MAKDPNAWLAEYLESIKDSIVDSDKNQNAKFDALDKKLDKFIEEEKKERKTLETRVTALENFRVKAVAYATAASALLVYLPKWLFGFMGVLIK